MKERINRERLAATFGELCAISSPSRREGQIAAVLKEKFTALGADYIYEDGSANKTGSDCGNLIIRFNGRPEMEGFFLSCHMDTVGPCDNITVVRKGDIFTSGGDTILGADDKSGIAAILESLQLLKENDIPHPTIEVVITTCEEIGLLGAKHLEFDKLQTGYGYALDSSGIDLVIVGAPTANRIVVEINGQAAHAGLCPEDGINALAIGAEALSRLTIGRLDEESTCNFGLIEGGVATNIVPARVTIRGEVRSHSTTKLAAYTQHIKDTFDEVVAKWPPRRPGDTLRPSVQLTVENDYPPLRLSQDSAVLQRIRKAAASCSKELQYLIAGGGSDANIYCGHGLPTAIVATGMDQVHTTNEQQDLNNLVSLTEILYSLAVTTK
jgi:tripeptide aminopeptidase